MYMKFYIFKVIIEDDPFEDGTEAYRAYVPLLEEKGASTWGRTKEEAFQNLQEVIQMVVESMMEHGEKLPEEPADLVTTQSIPVVTVAA
jgi:predicted RNase H-like HicB family nuclease